MPTKNTFYINWLSQSRPSVSPNVMNPGILIGMYWIAQIGSEINPLQSLVIGYNMLQRGARLVDGIKFANDLTWRYGNYPWYFRQAQCNHKFLINERVRKESWCQNDAIWEIPDWTFLSVKMERNLESKMCAASRG